MDLANIITSLKHINEQLKNLDNLKTEDIAQLSDMADNIMNSDEGAVFDLDESKIFESIEGIDKFEDFVTACVGNLKGFDFKAYFVASGYDKKASYDREAKVKDLIAKIETIGKLNTVIKECTKRFKDIDLDSRLEGRNGSIETLIEDAKKINDSYVKFSENPQVKLGIEQLEALEKKDELEAKKSKLEKEINVFKNKMKNEKDTRIKQVYQKEIDKRNAEIGGIDSEIASLDAKINGKSKDDIKSDIEALIPPELDKNKILSALDGKDPKAALEAYHQEILGQMYLYQNRKDKNSERRTKIQDGIAERGARATRTPKVFNEDDYIVEEDEIDAYIADEANESDLEKIKAEVDSLPAIYTDEKDLRKQVRDWLAKQDGDTKNPFKILARNIKARSKDTQDLYLESQKEKSVRARIALKKKKEAFAREVIESSEDSKNKTATIDEIEVDFRTRLRRDAVAGNIDLNRTDYRVIADSCLDSVLDAKTAEDDKEYGD